MKKAFFKSLVVAAALVLGLPAGAQVKHGINPADMDTSVRPGDDFFEYAGGGWMKANPLTAEYSSYGVFDDLAETNRKQLRELIDELGRTPQAQGSNGQKVIDLYRLALDSTRRNADGTRPLQADLAQIAAFKRANLTPFIAKQHLYLGNPFFGIGIDGDLMNSDVNALYMSAGTMGLPDRDNYLKSDTTNQKIQKAYKAYLEQAFLLCGFKKGDARRAARVIYDMEYQFAKASLSRTEQRDYTKLYNIFTIDSLQQRYPAINWQQYFELMGLKGVKQVILEQPKVMDVAQRYMATMSERDMRLYFAGELIKGNLSNLDDACYDLEFNMYNRLIYGQQEKRPRWKRALSYPNNMLGEALGEEYVKRYFAHGSKEKMMKLIGNLKRSLAEHIAALTWMSDSTKVNALVKLNTYTVKIGYPDKWRDYSKVTIDPQKSLFENVKGITYYETRRNLDKFGKPVDKDEWGMTPQTVNAYYNPSTNEICFPAAILQAPFFDVQADDATNYGAIGVVIGHEMTHGFDDQGRNFDQNGNMTDWWSEQDAAKFKAAAERLAAQFDQVEVLPGLKANGHLTLGENIADQGGLRVAFDAFKKTQQYREGKPIDGFTPVQRFYLSYGRIWAENCTDEAIRTQTMTDPHAIGRNRVNVTLRNIDTFFDAFGVKPGDKMWRDPADRAIIW